MRTGETVAAGQFASKRLPSQTKVLETERVSEGKLFFMVVNALIGVMALMAAIAIGVMIYAGLAFTGR